jgi:hypothetical protein
MRKAPSKPPTLMTPGAPLYTTRSAHDHRGRTQPDMRPVQPMRSTRPVHKPSQPWHAGPRRRPA